MYGAKIRNLTSQTYSGEDSGELATPPGFQEPMGIVWALKSLVSIIGKSDISRGEQPLDTPPNALFHESMNSIGATHNASVETRYIGSEDSSWDGPKKIPRDCTRDESIDAIRLRLDLVSGNGYFSGVFNSSVTLGATWKDLPSTKTKFGREKNIDISPS